MRCLKVYMAILLLLVGSFIYIGFRSESLLMFKWFEYIGILEYVTIFRDICAKYSLPHFVKYSLPDGLWLLSYMLIIGTIWQTHNNRPYLLFVYTLPVASLIVELLQYFFDRLGTFDLLDILSYTSAIIIYKLILLIR